MIVCSVLFGSFMFAALEILKCKEALGFKDGQKHETNIFTKFHWIERVKKKNGNTLVFQEVFL